MVFPSNKPVKQCPFCKTDIRNLGLHIINKHKEILEKLDNLDNPSVSVADVTDNYSQQKPNYNLTAPQQSNAYRGTINDLIKEKLDTMLNLKIIEMMSKNPNISLTEISQAITPQQPTKSKELIEQLREYKEIQSLINPNNPIIETDTEPDLMNVIIQAMPLLKEFIQNKKSGVENNDTEYRINETGSSPILKSIQEQVAEYREQSGSISEKSGIISAAEQSDNSIDAKSYRRNKEFGI